MEEWLPERVKTVVRALTQGAATTAASWRKQIVEHTAGLAPAPPLPPSLSKHVDRVAHAAFSITDADLQALRDDGHDDDVIFEITLAAALGAGLKRLRKGLAALRAGAPEQAA